MKISPKNNVKTLKSPERERNKKQGQERESFFDNNNKKMHNVCKCFYCRNDRA